MSDDFGPPRAIQMDEGVNGRMKCGLTFARIVGLNYCSKGLALILGFWNVGMALRVEFTIESGLMTGSRDGKL